jgi:putative transposase
VARKWTFVEQRPPGRPRARGELVALVVRMATENQNWGYTRIQGAIDNLGHKVGRGTVADVLRQNGIEPSPEGSKGCPGPPS